MGPCSPCSYNGRVTPGVRAALGFVGRLGSDDARADVKPCASYLQCRSRGVSCRVGSDASDMALAGMCGMGLCGRFALELKVHYP